MTFLAAVLCALHRRALDLGAISLTERCEILVSDLLAGTTGVQERFLAFGGRPILAPADEAVQPGAQYTAWRPPMCSGAPRRLASPRSAEAGPPGRPPEAAQAGPALGRLPVLRRADLCPALRRRRCRPLPRVRDRHQDRVGGA